MTFSDRPSGGLDGRYDPDAFPELYEDILPRRVVAFAIDAVVVIMLMIPAALVVAVLGLVTLGLGWFLYGPLFAIVALGYLAITLGGPLSATPGMRAVGIELRTADGGAMYPLLAAIHGALFWVSVSVLTPVILVVGLFSGRRRLLHDMLTGTVMLNAGPLHALRALRPGDF